MCTVYVYCEWCTLVLPCGWNLCQVGQQFLSVVVNSEVWGKWYGLPDCLSSISNLVSSVGGGGVRGSGAVSSPYHYTTWLREGGCVPSPGLWTRFQPSPPEPVFDMPPPAPVFDISPVPVSGADETPAWNSYKNPSRRIRWEVKRARNLFWNKKYCENCEYVNLRTNSNLY